MKDKELPPGKYDPWKQPMPIKFATEADDMANLPRQEAKDYSSALPLDNEPGRMHKEARKDAHVSDKVYLFPESYNALRIELDSNWPTLFKSVGYVMAFDAIRFIEIMDAALDTKTTFDSAKVDAICKKYLNLLRNKRGLSSIR
jgi:hypothetical protein